MKKVYCKPLVAIEQLCMDQPIALNCTGNFDDYRDLMEFGYFMEGKECAYNVLPNGGFDDDFNPDTPPSHDTICYHSNVQTAFLS